MSLSALYMQYALVKNIKGINTSYIVTITLSQKFIVAIPVRNP